VDPATDKGADRRQPPDHPYPLVRPELAYLKTALVLLG
jgi:hypothetical protein